MTVPSVSPSIVGRRGEILCLLEVLGGPDGPDEMRIKALAGVPGNDGGEFPAQAAHGERVAPVRQEEVLRGRMRPAAGGDARGEIPPAPG